MPISTASLLTGPTISVTGGTAQTFARDGLPVARGLSVSDVAEPDVRTRDSIVVKSTMGTLQTDGSWSKNRREAKFVSPDLLPDGTQDFPFFRIEYVGSPLHSAAKIAAMKEKAVQLLTDADFDSLWAMGSIG